MSDPGELAEGCPLGPAGARLEPGEVVWVVLFASVLEAGAAAIEARAAEWRALFHA